MAMRFYLAILLKQLFIIHNSKITSLAISRYQFRSCVEAILAILNRPDAQLLGVLWFFFA